MIQTSNLTYAYEKRDTIFFPDLNIERGVHHLILGASGSGKTTLLHLLAGLLNPKSGSIEMDGSNYSNLRGKNLDQFRGEHIGIVYQKGYFIESLNMHDNMRISPYIKDAQHIEKLANDLQVAHLLSKRPAELSVGEQQRFSIIRALAHHPKVILADEPTSALDNANCESVKNLLLEQADTNNATLLIVTHDQRLTTGIDRIIEIK